MILFILFIYESLDLRNVLKTSKIPVERLHFKDKFNGFAHY